MYEYVVHVCMLIVCVSRTDYIVQHILLVLTKPPVSLLIDLDHQRFVQCFRNTFKQAPMNTACIQFGVIPYYCSEVPNKSERFALHVC